MASPRCATEFRAKSVPNLVFTDLAIRALAPGMYFDDKTPSFGIRVGMNRKTWIVLRGVNRTKVRIGYYPAVSLQEARKKAMVTLGSPYQSATAPAFPDMRDDFLEKHGATLRPSSLYQIKRTLRLYFHWQKSVDKITHGDVAAAIDAIKKPSERAHALKDIKTFFSWCVPRYVAHSPCEGLRKAEQKSRSRVLSPSELAAVWNAAEACEYPFGPIVQLLILTGQRRGEIGGLRRSWIDTEARTITLPADITKNGREHRLPYGDIAAKLLATLPDLGNLLFPARGNEHKAFSGYSPSKGRLDRFVQGDGESYPFPPWTLHDLRRTFATNLASLGVRLEVTEKLLNHVSGKLGGIVGVYQRHDFQSEMRDAVVKWEAKLSPLVTATISS